MGKSLIIEGGMEGSWRICLPKRLEICMPEGATLMLERGKVQVQVQVIDGVRWLPAVPEAHRYAWSDLPSSPCPGLKLTCSTDSRDADIKELTGSAVEMQIAAAELMRKHEDLQAQTVDLRQRLEQALEQADWLKDALAETSLAKDRVTLPYEALKAKCAAYESTLEALRTPRQDELDELVQEQVHTWGAKYSLVRVGEGKYLYQDRPVSVTIKTGRLMARTASGLQPLRDWLLAMIP